MGEIIAITSSRKGRGTSTSAANLGTALAQLRSKVVLLDANIGLSNLDAQIWGMVAVVVGAGMMLLRKHIFADRQEVDR